MLNDFDVFDFWLVEVCFFSWGVSFCWSDGDGYEMDKAVYLS